MGASGRRCGTSFACIRTWDLKRLLSRGGVSVYEVARAIRLSDTRRPEVVAWINQFAVPPEGREDSRPALVRRRYFVLHAPRQTGRTSSLLALRDLLNGGSAGDYRCVCVNVETPQTAREDVGRAVRNIVNALRYEAEVTLGDESAGAVFPVAGPARRAQGVPLSLGRRPLGDRDVFEAREAIILRGETQLHQQADKLREPRVGRVIGPLPSVGDGLYSDLGSRLRARTWGWSRPAIPCGLPTPSTAKSCGAGGRAPSTRGWGGRVPGLVGDRESSRGATPEGRK